MAAGQRVAYTVFHKVFLDGYILGGVDKTKVFYYTVGTYKGTAVIQTVRLSL